MTNKNRVTNIALINGRDKNQRRSILLVEWLAEEAMEFSRRDELQLCHIHIEEIDSFITKTICLIDLEIGMHIPFIT